MIFTESLLTTITHFTAMISLSFITNHFLTRPLTLRKTILHAREPHTPHWPISTNAQFSYKKRVLSTRSLKVWFWVELLPSFLVQNNYCIFQAKYSSSPSD